MAFSSRPNVLLFNDTSVLHHIGCLAVADAHRRMIEQAGGCLLRAFDSFEVNLFFGKLLRREPFRDDPAWFEKFADALLNEPLLHAWLDRADAVVVNGEGSIHHNAGMPYLALLLAASRMGKRTALVNSVLQALSVSAGHPLKCVDRLVVREPISAREALRLDCEAIVQPDSMLEAAFIDEREEDFSGRIVIGDSHWDGSSGALEELASRVSFTFERWMIHQFIDWRKAVASLRGARLFVTGRHHGLYLAALAGVPAVLLPGNSHKIEGTLSMIDFPWPICRTADEALTRIETALADPAPCLAAWQRMLDLRPLCTMKDIW